MDDFGLAASSFSSFAFAQAGEFLFQFNPETDGAVFGNPDLLPELRNLRLGHSVIRDTLEKSSDEAFPHFPDLLEDVTLYINAVRECSATAHHLRLQSDPRFLKDPRVVTRQRKLLVQARDARTWSEKLQYRLYNGSLLTTRLDVASEDIRDWLDVSLFPNDLKVELSRHRNFHLKYSTLYDWVGRGQKMVWCTNTNDKSDKVYGLAVADLILRSSPGAIVCYTPFIHPSRNLVDILCHLLRQLLASQDGGTSVVVKGWFLSHRETKPSLEDARRILLNELRRPGKKYIIFSGTDASMAEMESLLPIFEDILETHCKLFVICPFPLPAQLQKGVLTPRGSVVSRGYSESPMHLSHGSHTVQQSRMRESPPRMPVLPSIMQARPRPPAWSATMPEGRFDIPMAEMLEPSLSSPPRSRLKSRLKSISGSLSRLLPRSRGRHQNLSLRSLPNGSNQSMSYESVLRTEFRKLVAERTPVAKVSLEMLVWLVFALDRLTLDEIQAVAAGDLGIDNGDGALKRLEYFIPSIHASKVVLLRDNALHFLRTQWLGGTEGIHADGPHALIAERCLSYIGSIFDMGKLPESEGELDEWMDRCPLLRYAGTFWAEHARQVSSASVQHTLAALLGSRHVAEICALMLSRSETATKLHRGAYRGMTGLHLASAFGLVNLVSQMLGSGKFSPCLRTDDGWTALHWAVQRDKGEVLTSFLSLPTIGSLLACKTNSEGCTALHFAIKHRRVSMVESMLKAKAGIDAKDAQGRTPLYLAVWSGQENVVRQLLSSEADPNIPSIYGTVLHCAVRRGTPSLIRTLISASGSRIDLNTKDVLAQTALQEAQARGRNDVATILIEAGAKPAPFTQAYSLGPHRGFSTNDGWQNYEVDLELSAQIRAGNQCICHILKPRKQDPRQAEGQATSNFESLGDLIAPNKSFLDSNQAASLSSSSQRVFRKTFDLTGDVKGQVQKYLLSERQILFKLQHPHIVRYLDSDEDPHRNEFLLYMEYCDKGDLESFHGIQLKDLEDKEDKRYGFVEDETTLALRPLAGIEVWAMIWQLASALACLHYGLAIRQNNGRYEACLENPWAPIIHRDVKPANIVMHSAESGRCLFKLCDLGIASHTGLGDGENQTQLIGTAGLQPPEVRQGELWTTRGDIFSLGETVRLTAKLKHELLNCQPFKNFLDAAREINEDSRPTSLEAMEIAYQNLQGATGRFSHLPRVALEEMRAVHKVLGHLGESYLLRSFRLTADLLDSSQPFQGGPSAEYRKNLIKRLWLLLDDGADYPLTIHLLILLKGRSPKEELSRKQRLNKVLANGANVNSQWVKSGWSPLHIAAQEGRLSVVETLLQYGAKVDLKDSHGVTAKYYAKENGLTEMVALLEGRADQ